jgi:uncharacterized protein YdhG (YjbR/CyaY superfamily)
MQRFVKTPREYLKAVPEGQRPLIDKLRELIREAAPEAREEIRYGMLAYDDDGGLFALAAQKHYVSLYVLATDVLISMKKELAGIDHGKGCLRFKKLESLPIDTLRELLSRAKASKERDCKTKE